MRLLVVALALWTLPRVQAQQALSLASRQQDLDYVSAQVPTLHANFFYQLSQNQFQNAVADLKAKLAGLTDVEFLVGLAQLVAMAGDAHTNLYLQGSTIANQYFHNLPFVFRWFDDGIFVTAAATPYSKALGTRLIRVGDFAVEEAVRRLGTVIPHANDQWLHHVAEQYLTGQQILQGLHLLPAGATSKLTFQTLAGEQFTLDVDTSLTAAFGALDASKGPIPDYLRSTALNYWYQFLASNQLVYFKYNRCQEMPSRPFAAFAADILRTLDTNPVDTLVFDFRGNPGGDSNVIAPLINGLVQRYPALAANPKLRVYAVIDKGTFSSGLDNAMAFKQPVPPGLGLPDPSAFVRVIGEPAGGDPQGYGNVLNFTLPASRMVGQYSTRYFSLPPGIPDLPTFNPDIPISIRSTDYFARHDPVMAAILSRSEGTAVPATGDVITVNAASFRLDSGVASGSFAAAFGAFSTVPDQVTVGGVPAKIVSAAATQVNFVVPSIAPGKTNLSVRAAGKELAAGALTIAAAGPGIFVLQPADPSQPGAVENQDFSINETSNPAAVGSIVQIFATGSPPVDSSGTAPVKVFFGDIPADVVYSAPLAQFPGLWQVNARVPESATGTVPVYLAAGGLVSNAVTVSVR
ncbi:MAG TPA: hypothetical protein VGF59_32435 [Bryobacteraceae bacterium]